MAGDQPKILAIVGPTASGKSAAAVELADSFGGEIVSADSMMVYKGMNIGTAKPPQAVRARIPHHCIDIVDPKHEFSVAEYQMVARRAIKGLVEAGKRPIVVGGTGLYVSAAIDNLVFPTTTDTTVVRQMLLAEAEEKGGFYLHDRLRQVDPAAAVAIHPNNIRRVVRALEVFQLTGERFSEANKGFKARRSLFDVMFVGIAYEKAELDRRIHVRTNRMLQHGWIEETAALFAPNRQIGKTAAKAIGYEQVRQHIAGVLTLAEAADKIESATRRYAKRQMTWFNADKRITWIKPEPGMNARETAHEIELYIKMEG
jgi:tRNA dimethylallyltransferase